MFVFFQAEDGIRDARESRVLGEVYKGKIFIYLIILRGGGMSTLRGPPFEFGSGRAGLHLSLILI